MARVQYYDVASGVRKTGPLGLVKYPEQIESWYKAARKAVPEIPKLVTQSQVITENRGHYLFSSQAHQDWVKFEVMDCKDNKSHIVIDRKANPLGG